MKKGLFLLLLFSLTVPASAGYVDRVVFEIDSVSVNSTFNSASQQLAWSNGGFATIKCIDGDVRFRVTVNATWGDMLDLTQPGGLAKASFGTGSFSATFFNLIDKNKVTPIASVSGSLYSSFHYNEQETQEGPSELYGAAVVKIDTWNVPGYDWLEDIGAPAGLTATTSNINQAGIRPADSISYQLDWNSNNTIVTLLADESGIPEPATMCLLGLGALGLIRRKRA